jgi:phage-related minor tail protein
MSELLNNFSVSDFLTSMVSSDINIVTGLVWLIIATIISMIGGAIGGMILAGKDIGYSFSAMLGALFAPAGVIPAILLGFVVLTLLNNY